MKIHLHSRQGLYEVERFGRNSITLSTKHSSFSVPTSDFKSFAGGLWNNQVSKDTMDEFLAVVRPDEYKFQVKQEDQILTLAARLDILQAVTKAQSEQIVNHIKQTETDEDKETRQELNKQLVKKSTEIDELNAKLRGIADRVYSQKLDYSKFKIHKGIKFIIQQDHYDDKINRFCWDPYGFTTNYHSSISNLYREGDYGTISGGWIKIIDNNVILYSKSGDYGVYDDALAIECAEKLFPTHKIYSYAGRAWDSELTEMFDGLPF